MKKDYHFTGTQLVEMGWDGDLNTLEQFKEHVKAMLEMGWNPDEMSIQEFALRQGLKIKSILNSEEEPLEDETNEELDDCEKDSDDEDDLEERRRRAEEAGWDEEEMDLEEFEDYFG